MDSRVAWSWCLCLGLAGLAGLPAWAGDEADEGTAKPGTEKSAAKAAPRYGPLDVEMRLRDGSRLRVELSAADKVTLRTDYGALAIPISDVRRVRRGDRLSASEEQSFAKLLKDLDADDFEARQAAQNQLTALGARVVGALNVALPKASVEARNRMLVILRKIQERGAAKPQPYDSVKTKSFEARGALEVQAFKVKARFGVFDIRFDEVDQIRWLCNGEQKTVMLEAGKMSNEWLDTDLDVEEGEELVLRCSGQINMNGAPCGPEGSNNWGQAQPFLMGAAIGRLGLNGKPFAIGTGTKLVPDSSERLYVRIHCFPHMLRQTQNYTGEFKVAIATGSEAEELERAAPER
jgi:hypothetical protein